MPTSAKEPLPSPVSLKSLDNLESAFTKASYLPNAEIVTLARLAIKLGKPILIEGPPGTGKTSLAQAMATVLQTSLYRIQCYEGITAEQIIGEFNYQKQLLAIELSRGKTNEEQVDIFSSDYFIQRPLLQSLMSPKPTVMLIDEIDRADEEFEAFLLEALGENQITIPELGTIKGKSRPVVILTSNGTRELSGALRRRALFLALDYPSAKREEAIIKLHVPELANEGLHTRIVGLMRSIRRNEAIAHPPSISEGIELAKALTVLGTDFLDGKIEEIMGLLVKSSADMVELKRQLHAEQVRQAENKPSGSPDS